MTEWWFPLAALIVACLAAVLLAAATGFVRRRLAEGDRAVLAGAVIAAVIVYVVGGFAYALWTAEPHPDGTDTCPGPPYTTTC